MAKFETFVSRLSSRGGFFQKLSSLIFLPYAFRSGIRMKQLDSSTFTAVLPFKRFNRNWYNAMAGAALLGNSEIASGMYLFGVCGGTYSIVCKELSYRFMRPCFGPAIYRVEPSQEIEPLLAGGDEFNFEVKIRILQQLPSAIRKERRIGEATAVFHVTPKSLRKLAQEKKRESRARSGSKGA